MSLYRHICIGYTNRSPKFLPQNLSLPIKVSRSRIGQIHRDSICNFSSFPRSQKGPTIRMHPGFLGVPSLRKSISDEDHQSKDLMDCGALNGLSQTLCALARQTDLQNQTFLFFNKELVAKQTLTKTAMQHYRFLKQACDAIAFDTQSSAKNLELSSQHPLLLFLQKNQMTVDGILNDGIWCTDRPNYIVHHDQDSGKIVYEFSQGALQAIMTALSHLEKKLISDHQSWSLRTKKIMQCQSSITGLNQTIQKVYQKEQTDVNAISH